MLPSEYAQLDSNQQTLWAILVTVKLWSSKWNEAKVTVNIHSPKVTRIINSGATRNEQYMTLARNVWLFSAINNFTINALDTDLEVDPAGSTPISNTIIDSIKYIYMYI
jgi:hypothetical protein